MSKLIILIAVVLGVLAIAQIVRAYEISSKLRNRREEDIPNRDNKLNATLLLGFMLFMFIGFIWLMCEYGWTGRGDAASVEGLETDWLLNLNFVIIIAVFFLTNFLLFFFAFKYVRKPGVKAYYFPHDNKLELIWTIVPAFVLAIIIIFGLRTWNDLTDDAAEKAVRVELFSKQFDWTVRMSGDDNTLALFDYKLTNVNNGTGLMTTKSIQDAIDSMEVSTRLIELSLNDRNKMFIPKDRELAVVTLDRNERLIRLLHQMKARHNRRLDKQAMDDLLFGGGDTLYLRKGQEYEFNFRSKDVIHSAYFPHFRAQMNTVPGMTTRFNFTPNVTTKEMRKRMKNEKFNYVLMCNKICGGSHYKMKLIVVVLDNKEYKKWYDKVNYNYAKKLDLNTPQEILDKVALSKRFKYVYPIGSELKELEAQKAAMKDAETPADSVAPAPVMGAVAPTTL